MDDMVEKVARAIGGVFAAEHDKFINEIMKPGEPQITTTADDIMELCARAAIEAMREPTETMICARFHALGKGGRHEWVAMINAALGSKGE